MGGSGVGPSSVRVRVRGRVANREFGGGLVTTGGVHSSRGRSRTDEAKWGNARDTVGVGHMGSTLDVGTSGVVGYGIGGTGS